MLALGAAGALAAQGDVCRPPTDSHEANTFAILSVPIAFTAAAAPGNVPGTAFGLELASLPSVSRIDATPTACRPDKGPENTNALPGLVRVRLAVTWRSLVFEAGWIPPVRVNGVEANLVALAVQHAHPLGATWALALRADAVLGSLRAPITCDDSDLREPGSDCFGGTRSDDRWQPGVFGIEATIGERPAHHRVRPYLGAGYTMLRPRFEVNFTNAVDSTDHRRIEVNLRRIAVFAGLSAQFGRTSLSGEAYATPSDAVSLRLVMRTALQ